MENELVVSDSVKSEIVTDEKSKINWKFLFLIIVSPIVNMCIFFWVRNDFQDPTDPPILSDIIVGTLVLLGIFYLEVLAIYRASHRVDEGHCIICEAP